MNKTKTAIKTNLMEEEIMQKYIVEVKAPKEGQKVSTGEYPKVCVNLQIDVR